MDSGFRRKESRTCVDTITRPSVVSHKSLYFRHPGESRGPDLDSRFRGNDGKCKEALDTLH